MSDFRASNCLSCPIQGCNQMGHWASPNKELGGLTITTQSGYRDPYCYIHHQIKATSNNLSGQSSTRGKFTVSLTGSNGNFDNHVIEDDFSVISRNTVITRTAEFTKDIGQILSARVSFNRSCGVLTLINCLLYDTKWSIKTLEIINPVTRKGFKLCPTTDYINSGSSVTFNLC